MTEEVTGPPGNCHELIFSTVLPRVGILGPGKEIPPAVWREAIGRATKSGKVIPIGPSDHYAKPEARAIKLVATDDHAELEFVAPADGIFGDAARNTHNLLWGFTIRASAIEILDDVTVINDFDLISISAEQVPFVEPQDRKTDLAHG